MPTRYLHPLRLALTAMLFASLPFALPCEASTAVPQRVSILQPHAPIHLQAVPSSSPDAFRAFSAGKRGDVNGDGKRNVSDIMLIVNYILGQANDDFDTVIADLSNDGKVNVSDIMILVNIILGMPYDDPDNPSLPTDDPPGGDPGGGV